MSNSVYHSGQVHNFRSTCNYAQFKLVKTNRPVNQDHLMRLYDAVEKKNLLAEFPILVDRNMNVIDGQHRLKVAESLAVPIYFIVSERITVDDISHTNANTLHWKMQDYMDRWLSDGKLEYLKLDRFCKKYPFLGLRTAAMLCHHGDGAKMRGSFPIGQYLCNDVAFATKVAEALLDFSKFYPYYYQACFVGTVRNLVANRHYDHKIMMARLEYQSTKLVRCPNADAYLELISEIYNFRTRPGNQRTFKRLSHEDPDYRTERKSQEQLNKAALAEDATSPFGHMIQLTADGLTAEPSATL